MRHAAEFIAAFHHHLLYTTADVGRIRGNIGVVKGLLILEALETHVCNRHPGGKREEERVARGPPGPIASLPAMRADGHICPMMYISP